MSVTILNIFEINYSQLIQYEILEKLGTYMLDWPLHLYFLDAGAGESHVAEVA